MINLEILLTSGLLVFILILLIGILKKVYCIDSKLYIIKNNDLPHLFKYTYQNYKDIKNLPCKKKGR